MDKEAAAKYIRSNFHSDDRLAAVLIQKSFGNVVQRISSAEQITSDDFQRWLRYMNREKYEVDVSMNALHADARGRTKGDVEDVRHVYLDFDVKGDEAVQALRSRDDVPTPNHLIESSPGKWQVVWRVQEFDPPQAEALMRGMVRELGADPAATDSSRVLRVPGFYNHKYAKPHFVRVQNLTEEVYSASRFPEFPDDGRSTRTNPVSDRHSRTSSGQISQSERDWAYANRALARGDDPNDVIRAIAAYRPDKPDPNYYAEHTVQKVLRSISKPPPSAPVEPITDPDR